VTVSEADYAAFQEAADEISAAWAKGLTNVDGQAFLDEAVALAEKYGG
jgi:hypothetical protein